MKMDKLIELLEKFIHKYGKFGAFVVLLIFLAFWALTHHYTPSRNTVSLFGIIEYQKSPDTEAIKSRRDLNIRLVHVYFDAKKEGINNYVNDVWLPQFIKEVFTAPFIISAQKSLLAEGQETELTKFFKAIGGRIQKKVNEKTISLSRPLNELEWRLIRDINNERQDIDKIIAITIDKLEGALNYLYLNHKNELEFMNKIDVIRDALNEKPNGYDVDMRKASD
jgi:hypothetical protein